MYPYLTNQQIAITAVENGFIVEAAACGDAPGKRHVFNHIADLGKWLGEWARGNEKSDPGPRPGLDTCPHASRSRAGGGFGWCHECGKLLRYKHDA